MEKETDRIGQPDLFQHIGNREAKEKVARKIAQKACDGDVIGAGSGSTVYLTLFALAERMQRENLHLTLVPASAETALTCIRLGIPLSSLWECKPAWCFDGADEVDSSGNLIKGRGGAMFKEKLIICNSPEVYILVDESKLVPVLGKKMPVPVEVFPPAFTYVSVALKSLGAEETVLRMAGGKDGPLITENGNFILDVHFSSIGNTLEKEIKNITGVIESGLFIGYPVRVVTG